MKIGLGSVQFGLNYGINNSYGKPDLQTVKRILKLASENNISLIDTAADYGTSEEVIGRSEESSLFNIVTKISREKKAAESVGESLRRLKKNKLYGVLVHDFQKFNSEIHNWNELERLKSRGFISKIGFSIYHPAELEYLLERKIQFDLIQFPYSVFDRRFDPYFSLLKANSVEVHCRSIFLQGLIFKSADSLNDFFGPIKSKIEEAHRLSQESGKSLQSLCLNFASSHKDIDKIILGVDTEENLKENILALNEGIGEKEMSRLEILKETNEDMLLPYKWKI